MANRHKYCSKCETSKAVEDFYRRKNGYLSAWCKPCTTKANNAHRAEQRRRAREARLALPPATTKPCTTCGEVKVLSDFYLQKSGTPRSECKVCAAERRSEYYHRPDVRTRIAKQTRARAEENRPKVRVKNLSRYGLTPAAYDSLFDLQGGKCAICATPGERAGMGADRTKVLCVDHHHGTGEVRGLLCSRCNRAIGLLGDDPAVIRAAINYLTKEITDV